MIRTHFRNKQRAIVEKTYRTAVCPAGISVEAAFAQSKAQIVFDVPVTGPGLRTVLHGVRFCSAKTSLPYYSPLRFVSESRIRKDHRILLAFDGCVLYGVTGQYPPFGHLVYGEQGDVVRIKLTRSLMDTAAKVADATRVLAIDSRGPELVLRKHCADCQFRSRCRKLAAEADDLSLIAGMSEKERKDRHNQGLFTVNQLSYAFRLRRNRKVEDAFIRKRHYALTALAIRERKIHVLGNPAFDLPQNRLYLDVEGIPECSSYYLIGICFTKAGTLAYQCFWADNSKDEQAAADAFLAAVEKLDYPRIIHYGTMSCSSSSG